MASLPRSFAGAVLLLAAALAAPARRADAEESFPPNAGAAPASADASSPRVYPIDVAAHAGLLEVQGANPKECKELDVTLHSLASGPIVVDLTGRHLEPRTGRVQRLGLGRPITPVALGPGARRGTNPILLAAGETRTIRMSTVCMDHGVTTPRPTDLFALSNAPTPVSVEVALRWWAAHPSAHTAEQVQEAVWANDPSMLEAPSRAPSPRTPVASLARAVRSLDGVVHLVRDGVMTSIDPCGVRRFEGAGIESAWSTPTALFVVAGGELRRLDPAGETWTRVASADRGPVDGMVPGPAGALMLMRAAIGADTLPTLSFARGASERSASAVAVRDVDLRLSSEITIAADGRRPGRALAAFRLKPTPVTGESPADGSPTTLSRIALYDVDLQSGKAARRAAIADLESVAAGPGGTFGTTSDHRLVRVDGDRAIEMPFEGSYSKLVAVGSWRIVVLTTESQLVSITLNGMHTDALPADASLVASDDDPQALSVDPRTDQVVWVTGDVARRWTPLHARAETFSLVDAGRVVQYDAR